MKVKKLPLEINKEDNLPKVHKFKSIKLNRKKLLKKNKKRIDILEVLLL